MSVLAMTPPTAPLTLQQATVIWQTKEFDAFVSPHLRMHEVVHSDAAARAGKDNWPENPELIVNCSITAFKFFEPIRNAWNIPISPNSFFRNHETNRLVGSKTDASDHIDGCAIDIKVPGVSTYDLAAWCITNLKPFHQIILEAYTPGQPNSGWVHLAFRPQWVEARKGACKSEVLTCKNPATNLFVPGLFA